MLLGLAGAKICPKVGAGSKTSSNLQHGARPVEFLVSGSALAAAGTARPEHVGYL